MRKIILSILTFIMVIPVMNFNVKALQEERRNARYDRWHYRYENAKGSYSHGETHPTSIDLPERYDSRDYGYVSSIKNQGMMGICWAFGAIGAMEININKNGLSDLGSLIDLSEAHLGYFDMSQKTNDLQLNPNDAIIPDSEYTFIEDGGSAVLASLTLAKGIGPVSESVAPFYPYSYTFVDDIPKDSMYQREYTLNTAYHPMADDIEGIKKLIYTQGGASIAYNSGNTDRNDQYVNRYGLSNHMIHIIGYDDTIPKEMFNPVARMDGAWIVKNSWGQTPNGGIYYLSYDASSLEVMAPNMVHKEAYDNNYFYQASSMMDTEYTKVGEPIMIGNVYEGQSGSDEQKEILHSVGVLLAGMNTEYELQIYLDPTDGNPESGTPVFKEPLVGGKTQKGYYTISLPQSIEIKKGQKFSVVFRLQNRNLNYYTPYYVFKGGEFTTFDVVEETHPNQSYLKKENDGWNDLHNIQKCVSIHALTNIVDPDYKPTKQLKLSDFSLSQIDYDFNNEYIEPILNKNNKELLEMVDYSISYENNVQIGEGKIIVFGMNDYEGSKLEYTFNINKTNLKQEYFEDIDFIYQTGKQLTPEAQMYNYDLKLVEGKDYIVEYGENIYDTNSKDEGTVTLTGIGNYYGTVTKTFDIVNPQKIVNNSVDVYPRDAGSASTKSEAHYGELVKAVAGYYGSGTAVLRWIVEGIDFGRGEEVYFTAYDSMNLVAYFVNEVSFNELLDLYNTLRTVQKGSANDIRWNHFVRELENARVLIDSASDYEKDITRAYVYLQDAYKMLNEPLDLTSALKALESIKQLNESDYDYRTWGTLQKRKVLLEKAIEDVNMTQDKLNTVITEFNSAKQALTGNQSSIRQTLLELYESKLLLDENTYTESSYYILKEKLDEVKVLLDDPNASETEMSKAYSELSQIVLVERGNADILISLINECLLLEENKYTPDTFSSLQELLQLALLIKNNPNDYSQKDIDEMYDQLKGAKDRLTPLNTSNKSLLIQLYNDNSNRNKDDYTLETWNDFKDAYDYAYSIIHNENISQDEVDKAYERLNHAIRSLKNKEKPVNKDALALAIANAKSLDLSTKTKESIEALNKILKQAQELYDDNNATQQEVDRMIIQIEETIQVLKDKPAMKFPDVLEGTWYYPYVQSAFEKDLMSGMDDGTYFKPSHPLSRAMAVMILYRMGDSPETSYTPKFSDVKANDWHAKAVVWAASKGVVSGYSGSKQGMFGPNDKIKRQDLAVMMYNYAKKSGIDTTTTIDFSRFEDGHLVNGYAIEAMAWCIENKIISGSEIGSKRYLNPQKHTVRAEAAKMFSMFDELINSNNSSI